MWDTAPFIQPPVPAGLETIGYDVFGPGLPPPWISEEQFEARLRYERYLKAERWSARRGRVLKRDGYKCFLCISTYGLQVHHKHYDSLYAESDDDLITLCAKCHKRHHGRRNA